MTANPSHIAVDEDVVTSLGALFADLPSSFTTDDGVLTVEWERALLGPARDILSRPGKGLRARTLERCWTLAGGAPGKLPELLLLVIELLHVGSLIIDDLEDDSLLRRGAPTLHRLYGVPLAVNTGNWLYFVALSLLAKSEIPADVRLTMYEDVSLALMQGHQGQALDLSVRVTEARRADVPGLVATSTRLKSGSLMQVAALLGARCAGAGAEEVRAIGAFGGELGLALQMLDDWSGVNVPDRIAKGREDLRLARLTWPWAWLADGGDEVTYEQVVRLVGDESAPDWKVDRVLNRLRILLATEAPVRIRAQLDAALVRLESGLGRVSGVDAVRSDLAELERAYG